MARTLATAFFVFCLVGRSLAELIGATTDSIEPLAAGGGGGGQEALEGSCDDDEDSGTGGVLVCTGAWLYWLRLR